MHIKPKAYPNCTRLKSNHSYLELLQLFPMAEMQKELNALENLREYSEFKIPTLPPRTTNFFTYAIIGERGTGHDVLIQHHAEILYDLGFISNNFITTIDCLDLITESRRGSVVAFLDMFEKTEGGILVVDLNNSLVDESVLDIYLPFLCLLLNHTFSFALYIKASPSEWENVESIFPSIRFIVRQVFTI